MKLDVIVNSGISADGFDTVIQDGDDIIQKDSWSYGYNCSYDRAFAESKKPYVTDVLQDLIDRYHVDEFDVSAGMNWFQDKAVPTEWAEEFYARYCGGLKLSEDLSFADAVASIPEDRPGMEQ